MDTVEYAQETKLQRITTYEIKYVRSSHRTESLFQITCQ